MDKKEIRDYLETGAIARRAISEEQIYELSVSVGKLMLKGGKLILMGNGGSAADAQHIAAEFMGRFEKERRPLFAIALHTNTSIMTAIANDYGYEKVFVRQVEAIARPGDVVIGISTSGNSPNVLLALEKAKSLGCETIAMTGKKGGKMADVAKHVIRVESDRTPIIQECHIAIGHIMSKVIEDMIE